MATVQNSAENNDVKTLIRYAFGMKFDVSFKLIATLQINQI